MASTARAVSGAGTKLRRRSFGSDLISAVIEFLAQRRYLPSEFVATEAGQHLDGHVHGDAVVLGARLEPVGQRQRQVARAATCPAGRRVVVVAQQVVAGEREQVGSLVPLLLPPRVEVPRRDDVGGDAGVVEGVDLVVADEQIAAAGPLLHLGEFLAQPGVVAEEVVAGLPVALDERVPDEQIAGQLRVDLRVPDAAARHQRQAVERHPFEGHHRAALGIPVRLAVGALHEMRRRRARRSPARCAPRSGRTACWSRRGRRRRSSAAAAW